MWGVEESLKRLNTDYIDIYYAHTPDYTTPIEETLRLLILLSGRGKYGTLPAPIHAPGSCSKRCGSATIIIYPVLIVSKFPIIC